jgi:DNA-binding transcriptional ArsR family regulator
MNSVFKALSDATRRKVLQLLREGPLSAGELADQFVVSKSTMSAHFAVLQAAGLIEAEKNGRVVLYRLKLSVLEDALLGFAGTFGWSIKERGPARGRAPASKRAIKGGALCPRKCDRSPARSQWAAPRWRSRSASASPTPTASRSTTRSAPASSRRCSA